MKKTKSMPALQRADHLAFPSFDANATLRFYTDVMGLRLKFAFDGTSAEWGGKAYLMTAYVIGNTEIHFFDLEGIKRPKADNLPKDIRHIAFSVKSRTELRSWKLRLETHRVPYWEEDHGGSRSIYFSDPNGVVLEINDHRPEAPDRRSRAEGVETVRKWAAARRQSKPRKRT